MRAALAIRDGDRRGRQVSRFGSPVNTGEALVSVDARPERARGMVAGDVVNTALAPAVRCARERHPCRRDDLPRDAARDRLQRARAGRGEGQGQSRCPVWEVAEAKARVGVEMRGPATPLVGRERERDLAAVDVRPRSPRVARRSSSRIAGVPGIGKSRLVAELPTASSTREAELTNWRRGRVAPVRRGRHALGVRRDGQGAGRHPRERRRVRTPSGSSAKRSTQPSPRTTSRGSEAPACARSSG